jgi:hypothetical protein
MFVIHEGAGLVEVGVTGLVLLGGGSLTGEPVGGGGVPVIHPVAGCGPECRAVLRGSIKWAGVLVVARP